MASKLKKRLVATSVATLPEGDYTDSAVKGLQLRVRKGARTTSRAWLFRFKWRGESTRIVLGHLPTMGIADARESALAARKALDAGIDPRRARPRRRPAEAQTGDGKAPPLDKHSVDFLSKEFFDRHIKPTRKRPEYVRAILDRDVLPEWRGRDARTIKPREVIELLDSIVGRGSPVQANRVAGVLSQMFRFGVHRAIVETSPVQLLYRPGGKEPSRERALNADELRALIGNIDDACRSPRMAAVLKLLLLTGQRRGEIALARWSDVDMAARTWTIPDENAKAGRGHTVPLSAWAVREFEQLKKHAGRSRFVFPNDDGSAPADAKLITRSVARSLSAFKRIGIEAFTPHDLRRTVRTGLARLKVTPHIAERVLNHAQEKIAGTYDVHDYADEKRAALDQWASYLDGLQQ